MIASMEFLKLYEIWSVFVYDGVERQPVAPRGREVAYIYVVVAGRFHLAP